MFEWRGRLENTEMYFLLRRDSSWQEVVFLTFPHFSDEEVYRPKLNYKFDFHLAQFLTACVSYSPEAEEVLRSKKYQYQLSVTSKGTFYLSKRIEVLATKSTQKLKVLMRQQIGPCHCNATVSF